jgi:hypothetical protein
MRKIFGHFPVPGRQKGQAMHHKSAALTGGLILAVALAIPAAANAAAVRPSGPARPADTNQGCGVLFDQGNDGNFGLYCNYSIPINGEFEIVNPLDNGCLAVNTSQVLVDDDSAAACSGNGGKGATWDRWTATQEGTSGGARIWEFRNQFNGDCLYNDTQFTMIYAACSNKDHFEWWTWPDSNL